MPQLDFLETEETFDWSIEKKIDQAQEVIRALLRKNTPLVLAYSGGKDSSVVASLVLTAAAEAVKEEGLSPLIIVTSSDRSEEHTSELQSLMRISYAVFFLKKKKPNLSNLSNKLHNHKLQT